MRQANFEKNDVFNDYTTMSFFQRSTGPMQNVTKPVEREMYLTWLVHYRDLAKH